MNISESLQSVLYHVFLEKPEYFNEVAPEYFDNPDLQKLFKSARKFREKFLSIPTSAQLKDVLLIENLEVSDEVIKTLYNVDMTDYTRDWLEHNAEAFIRYKVLETSIFEAVRYMRSITLENSHLSDVVLKVDSIMARNKQISFGFEEGMDFFDVANHYHPENAKISSGYKFIDHCNGGGFDKKSLNVYGGLAKIGKSIWLINTICNQVRLNLNCCYVSLEMKDYKIAKRMSSNLFKIPINLYEEVSKDVGYMKRKKDDAFIDNIGKPLGQLHIKDFPASTASVIDVESYLQKAQDIKKCKYDVVAIDYLNIMKNYRNPNSENLYVKIKEIAEDLRAMADRNDWTILSATQYNRSGGNTLEPTLANISESHGLAATVDTMFGIVQDSLLKSRNEYFLKALAIRDGEGMNSKKKFKIDYNLMTITEDAESAIIEENY